MSTDSEDADLMLHTSDEELNHSEPSPRTRRRFHVMNMLLNQYFDRSPLTPTSSCECCGRDPPAGPSSDGSSTPRWGWTQRWTQRNDSSPEMDADLPPVRDLDSSDDSSSVDLSLGDVRSPTATEGPVSCREISKDVLMSLDQQLSSDKGSAASHFESICVSRTPSSNSDERKNGSSSAGSSNEENVKPFDVNLSSTNTVICRVDTFSNIDSDTPIKNTVVRKQRSAIDEDLFRDIQNRMSDRDRRRSGHSNTDSFDELCDKENVTRQAIVSSCFYDSENTESSARSTSKCSEISDKISTNVEVIKKLIELKENNQGEEIISDVENKTSLKSYKQFNNTASLKSGSHSAKSMCSRNSNSSDDTLSGKIISVDENVHSDVRGRFTVTKIYEKLPSFYCDVDNSKIKRKHQIVTVVDESEETERTEQRCEKIPVLYFCDIEDRESIDTYDSESMNKINDITNIQSARRPYSVSEVEINSNRNLQKVYENSRDVPYYCDIEDIKSISTSDSDTKTGSADQIINNTNGSRNICNNTEINFESKIDVATASPKSISKSEDERTDRAESSYENLIAEEIGSTETKSREHSGSKQNSIQEEINSRCANTSSNGSAASTKQNSTVEEICWDVIDSKITSGDSQSSINEEIDISSNSDRKVTLNTTTSPRSLRPQVCSCDFASPSTSDSSNSVTLKLNSTETNANTYTNINNEQHLSVCIATGNNSYRSKCSSNDALHNSDAESCTKGDSNEIHQYIPIVSLEGNMSNSSSNSEIYKQTTSAHSSSYSSGKQISTVDNNNMKEYPSDREHQVKSGRKSSGSSGASKSISLAEKLLTSYCDFDNVISSSITQSSGKTSRSNYSMVDLNVEECDSNARFEIDVPNPELELKLSASNDTDLTHTGRSGNIISTGCSIIIENGDKYSASGSSKSDSKDVRSRSHTSGSKEEERFTIDPIDLSDINSPKSRRASTSALRGEQNSIDEQINRIITAEGEHPDTEFPRILKVASASNRANLFIDESDDIRNVRNSTKSNSTSGTLCNEQVLSNESSSSSEANKKIELFFASGNDGVESKEKLEIIYNKEYPRSQQSSANRNCANRSLSNFSVSSVSNANLLFAIQHNMKKIKNIRKRHNLFSEPTTARTACSKKGSRQACSESDKAELKDSSRSYDDPIDIDSAIWPAENEELLCLENFKKDQEIYLLDEMNFERDMQLMLAKSNSCSSGSNADLKISTELNSNLLRIEDISSGSISSGRKSQKKELSQDDKNSPETERTIDGTKHCNGGSSIGGFFLIEKVNARPEISEDLHLSPDGNEELSSRSGSDNGMKYDYNREQKMRCEKLVRNKIHTQEKIRTYSDDDASWARAISEEESRYLTVGGSYKTNVIESAAINEFNREQGSNYDLSMRSGISADSLNEDRKENTGEEIVIRDSSAGAIKEPFELPEREQLAFYFVTNRSKSAPAAESGVVYGRKEKRNISHGTNELLSIEGGLSQDRESKPNKETNNRLEIRPKSFGEGDEPQTETGQQNSSKCSCGKASPSSSDADSNNRATLIRGVCLSCLNQNFDDVPQEYLDQILAGFRKDDADASGVGSRVSVSEERSQEDEASSSLKETSDRSTTAVVATTDQGSLDSEYYHRSSGGPSTGDDRFSQSSRQDIDARNVPNPEPNSEHFFGIEQVRSLQWQLRAEKYRCEYEAAEPNDGATYYDDDNSHQPEDPAITEKRGLLYNLRERISRMRMKLSGLFTKSGAKIASSSLEMTKFSSDSGGSPKNSKTMFSRLFGKTRRDQESNNKIYERCIQLSAPEPKREQVTENTGLLLHPDSCSVIHRTENSELVSSEESADDLHVRYQTNIHLSGSSDRSVDLMENKSENDRAEGLANVSRRFRRNADGEINAGENLNRDEGNGLSRPANKRTRIPAENQISEGVKSSTNSSDRCSETNTSGETASPQNDQLFAQSQYQLLCNELTKRILIIKGRIGQSLSDSESDSELNVITEDGRIEMALKLRPEKIFKTLVTIEEEVSLETPKSDSKESKSSGMAGTDQNNPETRSSFSSLRIWEYDSDGSRDKRDNNQEEFFKNDFVSEPDCQGITGTNNDTKDPTASSDPENTDLDQDGLEKHGIGSLEYPTFSIRKIIPDDTESLDDKFNLDDNSNEYMQLRALESNNNIAEQTRPTVSFMLDNESEKHVDLDLLHYNNHSLHGSSNLSNDTCILENIDIRGGFGKSREGIRENDAGSHSSKDVFQFKEPIITNTGKIIDLYAGKDLRQIVEEIQIDIPKMKKTTRRKRNVPINTDDENEDTVFRTASDTSEHVSTSTRRTERWFKGLKLFKCCFKNKC